MQPKANSLAPARKVTPPEAPKRDPFGKGPFAEMAPIGSVTPWAKNPRRISQRAIDKVARSIDEFGWSNPIILRKANRQIVAGHTRYLAAKKLGLTDILVRALELTEKQARKLAIADNRTGEETQWDDDLLAMELRDLKSDGEDMTSLGFDDDEMKDLLAKPVSALAEEGEESVAGARTSEGSGDGEADEDGDGPAEPTTRGFGKPVIGYSIVFDTEDQQKRWYDFLRKLKADYPNAGTVGERLALFIDSVAVDAAA
jgi:hypothetical protein